MKNFPISIYDDFYDDPEEIRKVALEMEFSSQRGVNPHLRTNCLSTVNPELHYKCVHKFLSIYGDFDIPDVQWHCQCFFQKSWRFSSDIDDPINQGWIHSDDGVYLAGIAYLSHNTPLDTGTSFYRKKDSNKSEPKNMEYDFFQVLGTDEENLDQPRSNIESISRFRNLISDHNDSFTHIAESKNVYNRMIAYDSSIFHAQSNYWMPNDDDYRLIQLFFVDQLISPNHNFPISRCNRYAI